MPLRSSRAIARADERAAARSNARTSPPATAAGALPVSETEGAAACAGVSGALTSAGAVMRRRWRAVLPESGTARDNAGLDGATVAVGTRTGGGTCAGAGSSHTAIRLACCVSGLAGRGGASCHNQAMTAACTSRLTPPPSTVPHRLVIAEKTADRIVGACVAASLPPWICPELCNCLRSCSRVGAGVLWTNSPADCISLTTSVLKKIAHGDAGITCPHASWEGKAQAGAAHGNRRCRHARRKVGDGSSRCSAKADAPQRGVRRIIRAENYASDCGNGNSNESDVTGILSCTAVFQFLL